MKRKYFVILICVVVLVIITCPFIYKGLVLKKYDLEKLDGYEKFSDMLKMSQDYVLKTKSDSYEKVLSFKEISIKNDWDNLELENDKEYSYKYIIKDESNNMISSVWLGKNDTSFIDTLLVNSTDKESLKQFLEKENINNMIDLFKFLKDARVNITTKVSDIKNINYIYSFTIAQYGNLDNIKFIVGDYKGIILDNSESTDSLSLSFIKDNKNYFVTFFKRDYFTDLYIKEIAETIRIK